MFMNTLSTPRYHPDLAAQAETQTLSQAEVMEKINSIDITNVSEEVQEKFALMAEKMQTLGDNVPSSVLHFIEKIEQNQTPSTISLDTIKTIFG